MSNVEKSLTREDIKRRENKTGKKRGKKRLVAKKYQAVLYS